MNQFKLFIRFKDKNFLEYYYDTIEEAIEQILVVNELYSEEIFKITIKEVVC